MRTFSICALALMGCSLTSKLNLPSLTTSSNSGYLTQRTQTAPSTETIETTPSAPSKRTGATRSTYAGPAPAGAPWCSQVRPGRDILERALTDEEPDRAVPALIQHICHPDGDAKAKRTQLEARRQYWMQRLVMSEADWASDAPAWAEVPYSVRNTARVEPAEDLAWSATGPVEQFALLSMKTGDVKAFALQAGGKAYMADAFALSQAGRVAYIEQCLHSSWEGEVSVDEWAACQPDIDALDASKFAAELRGDTTRSQYDRMVVRITWANLQPKLAAHAAKVKQLLSTDRSARTKFEIARDMHKTWKSASYPALALVSVLDDARAKSSNSSPSGCSEKAWPAVAAALGKVSAAEAASVSPFTSMLSTPQGYLAANALVGCEGKDTQIGQALDRAMGNTPGQRGPRTASLSKFEVDGMPLPLAMRGDYRSAADGSASGIVAAVRKQDTVVLVEFKKAYETVTECAKVVVTNRFRRFDIHGNAVYYEECAQTQAKRVDTTIKPVTVDKRHAGGLVAGVHAQIVGGVAVSVSKPGSKVPTHIFGVAVK